MPTTILAKYAITALFLAAHGIASWKKWYYKKPSVDTITHFLGGMMVGAWVGDWTVAIALILGWEFLEMVLIRERRQAFRESPINKARDVLVGLLGYLISYGMV